MERIKSKIPFDYKTIKITQSRINKGLLAIPVSLLDYFPNKKTTIDVLIDDITQPSRKVFTPYTSSTRECRIGGMREFYEKFNLKNGDEIVVQKLDDNKYRIFAENQFENVVTGVEKEFDKSDNEDIAISRLNTISKITNTSQKGALLGEYYRLTKTEIKIRKQKILKPREVKENTPPSIRKLLTEIYNGKCQITGFGFLTKKGKPYFEVHHVKPELGNHLKNILVVSPNTHAQFTHAFVKESFDNEDWLRGVKFNGKFYMVNQIIDKIPKKFEKEVHFEN